MCFWSSAVPLYKCMIHSDLKAKVVLICECIVDRIFCFLLISFQHSQNGNITLKNLWRNQNQHNKKYIWKAVEAVTRHRCTQTAWPAREGLVYDKYGAYRFRQCVTRNRYAPYSRWRFLKVLQPIEEHINTMSTFLHIFNTLQNGNMTLKKSMSKLKPT